jgi:hypothetical protein
LSFVLNVCGQRNSLQMRSHVSRVGERAPASSVRYSRTVTPSRPAACPTDQRARRRSCSIVVGGCHPRTVRHRGESAKPRNRRPQRLHGTEPSWSSVAPGKPTNVCGQPNSSQIASYVSQLGRRRKTA